MNRNARGWPPRSATPRNASTSWSTTPAPPGAPHWRSYRLGLPERALDLNLKAPFYLTRAFLPLLQAAGTADDPARVINIGSIDGLRVPEFPTYSYSASKAGLHQLTRVLARELGPRHITVNAVAPGPFESKMMAATLAAFGDEIAAAAPLGRIGHPGRHGRCRGVPEQPGGSIHDRRRHPGGRRDLGGALTGTPGPGSGGLPFPAAAR